MITRNQIYSAVESAVNTTAHPVYCTSKYVPVPSSFPCCYIVNIDAYPEKANLNLTPSDNQKRFSYEVQTFSNKKSGAEAEARTVMGYAEASFLSLGFVETMCRASDNADPDVFRVIARFERVIGSDDTLPNG